MDFPLQPTHGTSTSSSESLRDKFVHNVTSVTPQAGSETDTEAEREAEVEAYGWSEAGHCMTPRNTKETGAEPQVHSTSPIEWRAGRDHPIWRGNFWHLCQRRRPPLGVPHDKCSSISSSNPQVTLSGVESSDSSPLCFPYTSKQG